MSEFRFSTFLFVKFVMFTYSTSLTNKLICKVCVWGGGGSCSWLNLNKYSGIYLVQPRKLMSWIVHIQP